MTNAEQFKLIAKILKQYEPFSEDRIIAGKLIKHYQTAHQGNLLRCYLEKMINA